MSKKKICPVCGEPYIRKANFVDGVPDHYYHVVEKLFGIDHYPPSGLCVVGSMRQGKDIDNEQD